MDLALCLFEYFPYGGLQRDFLKVAQLALEKGHRVTCYTMSWEGEVPAGLILKVLIAEGITNHARCWHFAQRLTHHLLRAHHDTVLGFNRLPHCDFYFAGDACLKAKLEQQHPLLSRILPRYRTFLRLEYLVFNAQAKTQILLLNPEQEGVFQQCYQTPAERFHLIPPSVAKPTNHLSKKEARQKLSLGIPLNVYCLLMVGQDLERKGLDRNLRALASLPTTLREKTFLMVVGTHKLDFFKKMAERLNLKTQVHFLGARDDVYTWMQAADLLVHPAYQETAGMVLVEALVNSLPVVVTSNCGYAFHVERAQAGVIVPGTPFNQTTYNQALLNAIQHFPDSAWAKNALAYANANELSNMAERILSLMENLKSRVD